MTEARKANSIARWFVQVVLPIGVAASLLTGVLALGQHLRERMKSRGEPSSAFMDLECDPPDGLTRQQFLEETQYLANLPETLDIANRETTGRIHQALSVHPWVKRVHQVRVVAGGRLRAELEYRRAVLAIAQPAREVDGEGILLPRSSRRKELPMLTTKVKAPKGKPGLAWGDVRVTAAAQVIALLPSHLKLAECTVEIEAGEVTLLWPRGRLVWGRPPGQEQVGEAKAETKLGRLPEATALVGQEWDMRPAMGARQRAWVR